MHSLCGKINRLRLIYHGFGEFTIERWRGHVLCGCLKNGYYSNSSAHCYGYMIWGVILISTREVCVVEDVFCVVG